MSTEATQQSTPTGDTSVTSDTSSTSADGAESVHSGGEGGAAGEQGADEQKAAPAGGEKPGERRDPMGPRFAALARQQKEIVKAQQELKAKEDALAAREADVAHLAKAKAAADKGDYDALLEHLGAMTDDTALTRFMQGINGVVLRKKDLPPEVVQALREVKQLKDEREAEKKAAETAAAEKKKAEEAAQLEAGRAAVEDFLLGPASDYITQKKDDLEVLAYSISREDSRDRVLSELFNKIAEKKRDHEKQHGKDSFTEAELEKALATSAQEVEDRLVKLFGSEIATLSGLKKLQPKKDEKKTPTTKEETRRAVIEQLDPARSANSGPTTLTPRVVEAPVRGNDGDPSDPKVAFQNALKLL